MVFCLFGVFCLFVFVVFCVFCVFFCFLWGFFVVNGLGFVVVVFMGLFASNKRLIYVGLWILGV